MRVLLLCPYPKLIEAPILGGDDLVASMVPPSEVDFSADFIVSFGYRHILKEPILRSVARPIINIHIGYLPWNRGADPNFWSWFEDTPKGVSIHHIDVGIDTGPLLAQAELAFPEPKKETLATTYEKLQMRAVTLFAETWPLIRTNRIVPEPQRGVGSFHRLKDKEPWWSLLPKGYDTPIEIIQEMGAEQAASNAFWDKYDEEIAAMKPPSQSK